MNYVQDILTLYTIMNYVQDILTLLYNDEHPDGPTSFDLGHTKVPSTSYN